MHKLRALLFSNTSTGQTVAKNTFWLFSGEVFGRIIRFAIVIYATRLLGPADYGVFAYVMAISAFLVIFSDIGVSAILTREAVRNPDDRAKYVASSLALKFILIFLNALVLLFVVPLFTRLEGALELLPLVALVFIFDSLREFGFGLNRALERMEKEALVKILMNTAIAVLGLIFLSQAKTPAALLLGYVIGSGIGFLLIFFFLRNHFKKVFFDIRWRLILPILRAAVPIGLMGLLTSITLNTDLVMLGSWRSAEEVGWYALAQKIILLFYILPTLLASAVFPALVRLRKSSEEKFAKLLSRAIATAFMFGLPIAVGGIILAKPIVAVFGLDFLPATLSLQILLISLVVIYPTTIIVNALVAYDEQKKFLIYVLIGSIGNVIFNILFIPIWGIEGAALSTLVNQLIANSFVWFQLKRKSRFNVLRHLWRIVLATIVMGVFACAMQFIHANLAISLIGSILVYFGVLFGLREKLLKP